MENWWLLLVGVVMANSAGVFFAFRDTPRLAGYAPPVRKAAARTTWRSLAGWRAGLPTRSRTPFPPSTSTCGFSVRTSPASATSSTSDCFAASWRAGRVQPPQDHSGRFPPLRRQVRAQPRQRRSPTDRRRTVRLLRPAGPERPRRHAKLPARQARRLPDRREPLQAGPAEPHDQRRPGHDQRRRADHPGQPLPDSGVVEVIDTGPGIPSDQRGRVFDVYYSTKKHGTGLGLPTTRRIVHEHGGTVAWIRGRQGHGSS